MTDSASVDYRWVMEVTFVLTIVVGAPVVAVLSAFATFTSLASLAEFAIRVGAAVWFVTGLSVFAYARSSQSAT